MASQADLFAPVMKPPKAPAGRAGPRLWVRRLAVFRDPHRQADLVGHEGRTAAPDRKTAAAHHQEVDVAGAKCLARVEQAADLVREVGEQEFENLVRGSRRQLDCFQLDLDRRQLEPVR